MNTQEAQRKPRRPQVLLIEDDLSQAALIQRKLEKASFEVVACQSVESGLRLSEQYHFAVAIVDLNLDGQNGLDFVRRIAKARSKTKVILHSVDSSFQSVKEGLHLGVFSYVEKGRIDNELIDYCHRASAAYLSDTLDAANEEIAFQLRLLEAVDHGIVATDPHGKVVYWNRFSQHLTGLSEDATVGRSIFNFFLMSPNDRKIVEQQMELGGNWHGECLLIQSAKNPDPILVRVAISVLRDSRGGPIGSVMSYHDLSEVKANEKRLELRARLLTINAELGRLAVEIADRNTFLKTVLAKIDEGLSIRSGRVLLQSTAHSSPEFLACIDKNSRSATSQVKLPDIDQLQYHDKIEIICLPLLEHGELIGRIEVEFESTNEFGSETKDFLQSVSSLVDGVLLRNWATRLWKSLFENSLDAVLIANDQGRFIDVNLQACELLGYSRDAFSVISVADLDPSDRIPNHRELLLELLGSGKLRGEIELIRKDSTVILVEFHAVANILPGIHIAHLRDITGRKRSEKLISEQQDQLTHVQRTAAMGQMAAVLAHEINQPLGAISNFSGGLLYGLKQTSVTECELSETLEKIHGDSLKAGAIINRLRKFITREPLHIQWSDLNSIIRDTLKILANLLSNNDIEVRLVLDESLPAVHVDPIQIQQVLVNVVKNSVEALQAGVNSTRWIQLATVSNQDCVQISICDNGPAVTNSVYTELFKPYHTTKSNGLGMGLCISRSILEQHQGTMEMTQLSPNGMLTTICLPIQ